MRRFVRLGAPAIALAAAILGVWRWSHHAAPAPQARSEAEDKDGKDGKGGKDDEVTAERDRLRGEVGRLGLEVAKLRAQREAAAPSPVPAAAEAVPHATPEQELAWMNARARFLDDTLAKEPRDERWAQHLESRARELYGKEAGVSLVSVACRSTSCRMEFNYPDASARLHHLHGVGERFPEVPRVSYAYPGEPDVHTHAVLFLAAEDHPLPAFDFKTFIASGAE